MDAFNYYFLALTNSQCDRVRDLKADYHYPKIRQVKKILG